MTPSRPRLNAALSILLGMAIIGGAGMAPWAEADQRVPIGAVFVSGAQGSEWHDQQLFRNPTDEEISGKLYVVERSSLNNENPGFDPVSSHYISLTIPANSTVITDDLYFTVVGEAGAGAAWFIPDGGDVDPIWRSRIFNQLVEGQNGMTIAASAPEFSPAGTTLSDVLSGDGYRDGLFLEAGPDGVEGYWRYTNGSGGNEVTVDQDLGPNRTFQWTGTIEQMLGFEPESGAQLDYVIESGSANAYLSRTNNETNDGAFNEFEAIAGEDTSAASYVAKWLPPARFYLNNNEIRAMINGGAGTRSYATDLAMEFFKDPIMQNEFDNVEEVEEWLRARADGVPGNSEFCPDFDPVQWTVDVGTRIYDGISCGPVDFAPGEEAMQNIYDLVRDEFLLRYVGNNPTLYGGEPGGNPDMSYNPTWNTQDPN